MSQRKGPACAMPLTLLQGAGAPLISAGAREDLVHTLQQLDFPTETLCLECRLGDDPRVDTALCLFPAARPEVGTALHRLREAHRELDWHRALALVTEWSEGRALQGVPFLYLAFDRDAHALAAPCLSLCVDPSFLLRRMGMPVGPGPSLPAVLAIAEHCCSRLIDAPFPSASMLQRLLTPEVEARHFSIMLGRTPCPLKLDLSLPTSSLSAYLRALGREDQAALPTYVREWMPWSTRLQLNYVLSDPFAPIELELCTGSDADDLARRAALLLQLVELRLVTPDKAEALLAIMREPLVQLADGTRIARNWYLKVRCERGIPTSAKAYVGLMPRPHH